MPGSVTADAAGQETRQERREVAVEVADTPEMVQVGDRDVSPIAYEVDDRLRRPSREDLERFVGTDHPATAGQQPRSTPVPADGGEHVADRVEVQLLPAQDVAEEEAQPGAARLRVRYEGSVCRGKADVAEADQSAADDRADCGRNQVTELMRDHVKPLLGDECQPVAVLIDQTIATLTSPPPRACEPRCTLPRATATGSTLHQDKSHEERQMRRRRSALRSFRRRLNRLIIPANRYLLEPRRPLADPIWLVGAGRSGTTWVSNILNYRNQYRYLFEPFHPVFIEATRFFRAYHYLRPHDTEPLAIARQVFTGRIQHPRIDKYTRGLAFQGLLIKDIFAHLFLKWVDVQFPSVRKILLLRHPFAVALSKLERAEWSWLREPTELLYQRQLRDDYLEPYVGLISKAHDDFEQQVLIWAITHSIPLQQLTPERLLLVFYEDLSIEPELQVRRMLEFLGDPRAGDSFGTRLRTVTERASQTSTNPGSGNRRRVDDWRTHLSTSQITNGIGVLREFGLDKVYGDDPMPDSDAAHALLGRRNGSAEPER